jgi:hypothetical protein
MVVTGTEGNPIVSLAKMSRTPLHRLSHNCRIYGLDGRPVPTSLDNALETEWNSTLDRCKRDALPEPRPDVSLGHTIRALVRQRRDWYASIEAELASEAAAPTGTSSVSLRERLLAEGECAVSSFQCEKCSRCFIAVEKLDRHRLLCLDEEAALNVIVRSEKSFSGFEGIVSNQGTGRDEKWEAYFHARGGARKRRRVGGAFDSPEDAARAYSKELRADILQEIAEAEAEAEAERRAAAEMRDDDGVVGVEAESDDDEDVSEGSRAVGGPGGTADMGEYEVDSILAERRVRVRGNTFRDEYLVKWKVRAHMPFPSGPAAPARIASVELLPN